MITCCALHLAISEHNESIKHVNHKSDYPYADNNKFAQKSILEFCQEVVRRLV